ncbi:unnamed protein product, partial [Effrenium voratum]
MAHIFTCCQRQFISVMTQPGAVGDKPQFAALKLHIEFDETQQDQIIHYGIIRNKAALPVLVQRLTVITSDGRAIRYTPLICPPATLQRTSA